MNLELDDLALFCAHHRAGHAVGGGPRAQLAGEPGRGALARLEAACAVRLVHRSTHGLSLTDEGDAGGPRPPDATSA